MKNIESEEIQLSLDQRRLELNMLKGFINLTKLTDTSYLSTQFDDYEKRMNKIDEDINILFNHPHNNEILHQNKSFNDEEEEHIQENCTLSLFAKERKKN
jgi:hypothetical protein